jgi:NADPH2 dehydrogenase
VHKKGSFIFLQLWALGRAADADQLKAELGEKGVVKSAVEYPFQRRSNATSLDRGGDYMNTLDLYAQAAKNAIEAGF